MGFEASIASCFSDSVSMDLYFLKTSCFGASCNAPDITTSWMKSEDLGIIIADKGMVEDHMPTHIINTLREYHKEVSGEIRKVFTNLEWRVESRRIEMMANEIKTKIEQRDIQLERGHIETDATTGIGLEDVDGVAGEEDLSDVNERVSQSKDLDRHSEFDVTEAIEEVDGGEPIDGDVGVSVSEAGALEDESGIHHPMVVESYGDEGDTYLELQPMDTVL